LLRLTSGKRKLQFGSGESPNVIFTSDICRCADVLSVKINVHPHRKYHEYKMFAVGTNIEILSSQATAVNETTRNEQFTNQVCHSMATLMYLVRETVGIIK